MNPLDIPKILREGDCRVLLVEGWRARGRPGDFDPIALLGHHTGATASAQNPMPSLSTLIHGRPDLNGPLAQLGLGFDGIYRMIAAGRANHAGTARASGPVPAGDGNEMYLGIEVDYSGSQDMSDRQYAALIKGSAALLKAMGKKQSSMRGHKETSSAGKWDPGRHGPNSPEYRMDPIREDIRTRMAPPPVEYRYTLVDGEGKTLAQSSKTASDEAARRRRLVTFLGNSAPLIDAEFQRDMGEGLSDVRILRTKAT